LIRQGPVPSGPACAQCVFGRMAPNVGAPPGAGFMQADGKMTSGVMFCAEALGAEGMRKERALVGSAGFLLARALSRKRWGRDMFRYVNAIWCRPAEDGLKVKGRLTAWGRKALETCAPHLDAEIDTLKPKAIVAFGDTAFWRLTGVELPIMSARGYVFREKQDRCWVIPTLHPEYLLKGNKALIQSMLWDIEKALRIAREGYYYEYTLEDPDDLARMEPDARLLCDPPTMEWEQRVDELCQAVQNGAVCASDIETPYKDTKQEEEDGVDVSVDDRVLDIDRPNRIAFTVDGVNAVTVPHRFPYTPGIKRVLQTAASNGHLLLFWNRPFDRPRLEKAHTMELSIENVDDTMDAWHVLHNAQPRRLGWVAPCLESCFHIPAWKHLYHAAHQQYSCMDVIVLWRAHHEVGTRLHSTGQFDAYDRLCIRLDPILERMTKAGLLIDQQELEAFKLDLESERDLLLRKMSDDVPIDIRVVKSWQRQDAAEKGLALLRERGAVFPEDELFAIPATKKARVCGHCGEPATKAHVTRKTILKESPHAQ